MKKVLCTGLAVAMLVNSLTFSAMATDNPQPSNTQTSSPEETVYVNSYGGTERTINFNDHWRFNYGDAASAETPNYNDAIWQDVDLPHDYSIDQPYTKSGEAESGYLPGGTGWYRKSFTVSPQWKNKTISVDFGGVYMNATVWLNGHLLGTHPYGYTAFSFVLPEEHLKFDGENVLAVKVENRLPSSRWYSGSGIYRSVSLTVTDRVHVARHGVMVTTPDIQSGTGTVHIETQLQNDTAQAAQVSVRNTVYRKGNDTAVATGTVSAATSIEGGAAQKISDTLTVANPELWSLSTPTLYTVHTEVLLNGTTVDAYDTEFGFRFFAFSQETGFSLNGQNLKLQGVCMHHDQGALGAEAWYRSMERQVEILKEMGTNAIRVTHNPAAKELIEICNRKGMLVIDEGFDTWIMPKNGNSNDYARWFAQRIETGNGIVGGKQGTMTWGEYDIKEMVHQDKNAPAVIAYSLGNEIFEGTNNAQASQYPGLAQSLINWIQEVDETRPTTFGQNSNNMNTATQVAQKIHEAGGVIGRNYSAESGSNSLADWHTNRGWKVYGSETASAVNSRGVYDRKGSQSDKNGDRRLTSYDKSAVGWGATASDAWWRTIRYDYNAGEFVWTGFDYLGEPTPWNGTGSGAVGGWPSPKNSYFGIIDTAGFPKDSFYFYQSQWNQDVHTLHILPTWNETEIIKDETGKVEVVVYSDAASIKLFLNDAEVGAANATKHTTTAGYTYQTFDTGTGAFVSKSSHQSLYATFNVPYEAGVLRAVAYDESGEPISKTEGRAQVKTTDAAAKLAVAADRPSITADGRDLSYITIDVQDAKGNFVNGAEPNIAVSVSGNGKLLALDNGQQNDHTPYTAASRNAMSGKLLAIVQSTDQEGSFTVTATSAGLTRGSVTVNTVARDEVESEKHIVSYQVSKNHYVLVGNKPVLPETVTVTYSDGSKEAMSVDWDAIRDEDIAHTGTFFVSGNIGSTGLRVTVTVAMMDTVAALLNYSTAIMVGANPTLPATRPAVTADGTVLTAEFPVAWKVENADFSREGTVQVEGTATVFDKQMPVTATVRVAKGSVIEGSNVAASADGLFLNEVGNAPSGIENLRDGSTSTTWSGQGAVMFRYATAQNLHKVVLEYAGTVGQASLSWSGDGNNWTPLQAQPAVSGTTATYSIDGLVPAVWVKLELASEETLAECRLITGVPDFPIYNTSTLSRLVVNGLEVDAVSLAKREYPTQALLVDSLTAESASNAAITVLPAHEDVVRILTVSENQDSRGEYRILLGQNANGNESAEDASRDYDYTKTTATAGSQQTPQSGSEGPVTLAVDNNRGTFWHSKWSENLENTPDKRWIMLTLEEPTKLDALRYQPRPSVANGIVTEYRVEVSTNGTDFTPVSSGTWAHDTEWKLAKFNEPVVAKYVKLYGVNTRGAAGDTPNRFMSAAEVRVRTASADIEQKDLSGASVTFTPQEYNYTGVAVMPRPAVVLAGATLRYGLDYKLTYADNIEPGTASVTVSGIMGYTGSVNGTFSIKEVPLTALSYQTVRVSTYPGIAPTLPQMVTAKMDIGPDRQLKVTWDVIDAERYASIGTFVVEGTVEGQKLKATATVDVIGIVAAQNVSAVTGRGIAPTLPTQLTVYFSNQSTQQGNVAWELEKADFDQQKDTIVPVKGTVTLENGLKTEASANVRIVEPSESSSNIALKTEGHDYPTAISSWCPHDGGSSDSPLNVIDGKKDFGEPKLVWSDWERGVYHTEPWVGIVLGENNSIRNALVNKVSVGFFDERATDNLDSSPAGAVRIPQSYRIEYYTGPAYDLTAGNFNEVSKWVDSPLNDSKNWTEVVVDGEYPAVPASSAFKKMLDITFEPVTAELFRVVMVPYPNQWVGLEEVEIYGSPLELNDTFKVDKILIGGDDHLADFDDRNELLFDLADGVAMPEIQVKATGNPSVTIVPALDNRGVTTIIVTPENGDASAASTYTIRYDTERAITVQGQHLTVDQASAVMGKLVTVSAKTGYTLATDSLKVHKTGDEGTIVPTIGNTFVMPSYPVTVSATTTPVTYRIAYNLAGGEVKGENPMQYTIESDAITLINPTRSGYTFRGWVGTGLSGQTMNVTIAEGSTGDRSYTAEWARNSGSSSSKPSVPTKPGVSVSGTGGKVSSSTDGTVTITPDTGYQIAKITVNGKEVTIPADGKLTGLKSTDKVVVTFEKVQQPTKPGAADFADMQNHWAKDAVQFVTENGIMNGTGTNTFGPDASMTRAMVWTVLARMKGVDTATGANWYEAAQKWSMGNGISDGTMPEGSITREQLATLLYRYSGSPKAAGAELSAYKDSASVSAYAKDAMLWAVQQGLISGNSDGTLNPAGNATRAEVATILMRLLKK